MFNKRIRKKDLEFVVSGLKLDDEIRRHLKSISQEKGATPRGMITLTGSREDAQKLHPFILTGG